MTVRDFAATLESWFPLALAEPWDNVGLLLGDPAAPVRRAMACLTVTPATVAEALRDGADLVVTHHPILFRPVQRLVRDDLALRLARGGVAVFSPHTAFDSGAGGINAQWAERLGLADPAPLRPAARSGLCKLVVYLPEADLERVSAAVFAAGGGTIGAYSECGFRAAGTGTFRGGAGTNPAVGQPGRREDASELRWETILPNACIPAAIAALRQTHSYEEPAFDLLPLAPLPGKLGGGRFGELPAALPLAEVARRAAAACGAPRAEFVGPPALPCRKIAVACGAAADFIPDAVRRGCTALVLGEATFHQQLQAEAAGLGLVLVGHYWSERFAVETLAERLHKQFPASAVWASRDERPPVRD